MVTHLVSYSEMDTWRQCPFKWQLAYHERWVGPVTSQALAKGSLTHDVLERYYLEVQAGRTPNLDQIWYEAGMLDRSGSPIDETAELVAWMTTRYADRWRDEDGRWEVVSVEAPVNVSMARGYRIKGKIDLVMRDRHNGKTWIWDHKTGVRLPTDKDLDLDVQFTLYAWALRKSGIPVHGLIWNALRTQRNKGEMALDDSFRRVLLVRRETETETVARDFLVDAKASRAAARKAGESDLPRHYDTERCGWRCSFTEACLAGAKGVKGGTRGILVELGYQQDHRRH